MQPATSTAQALPLAGAEGRPQRADAQRNRAAILHAARELFADRGPDSVSIEAVAQAAGVAKGTVFHHFGDRSGLALALLDEHERVLQEAILAGPPPLGPSAHARARLTAFMDALIALGEEHGELLATAEGSTPGSRYVTGAYGAWHRHVSVLVGELRPDVDADMLAHVLLAPFAADLHRHLRASLDADGLRLRATMQEYLRAICDG